MPLSYWTRLLFRCGVLEIQSDSSSNLHQQLTDFKCSEGRCRHFDLQSIDPPRRKVDPCIDVSVVFFEVIARSG